MSGIISTFIIAEIQCPTRMSRNALIILSLQLLLTVVYFDAFTKVHTPSSYYLYQPKEEPTKPSGNRQNPVQVYYYNKQKIKQTNNSTQDKVDIFPTSPGTVQTPTVPPTSSIQTGLLSTPASGYVIAVKVWEQMTRATGNLLDLQCWAARHHNSVVEPYFKDSRLLFTFDKSRSTSLLKLEDMFDMDDWRRYSKSNGLAPLLNEEEFFRAVGQKGQMWNVILVQMNYESKSTTCKFTWQEGARMVGTLKNMKVVRKVCIGAKKGTSVSAFDNHIFGSLRNTIVVFSEWRGIGNRSRLNVNLTCTKAKQYVCHKKISQRVLKDAEKYAQRYLGGFGQYIAIMTRFERSTKNYASMNQKNLQQYVKMRITQTLEKWKALKAKKSTPNTFLAFDYGRFGSDTFKKNQYYGSKAAMEQFHQQVYNRKISLHDWEVSFGELCNTTDSGYIALLQLAIATNAKCIVLMGEQSNFLNFAAVLYKSKHTVDRCMELVGHPLIYNCK